jgi:uncharacterized membrane protein YfcA
MAGEEIAGTFIIIIIAAMSNAGGIGGGGIMVPILIIVFFFSAHYAIPLSQAIIFGGSLMTYAMKMPARHPHKDRPLVDYYMAMHFQSPMLLGTTFGVFLNMMFPEWLILLLLTCVIGYVSIKTWKKGSAMWRDESEGKRQLREVKGDAGDSE